MTGSSLRSFGAALSATVVVVSRGLAPRLRQLRARHPRRAAGPQVIDRYVEGNRVPVQFRARLHHPDDPRRRLVRRRVDRPSGTSTGTGKIVVSEGRLLVEGRRGRGTGTLLRNPAGDLVLNVEMTLNDNSILTAKLWPSR